MTRHGYMRSSDANQHYCMSRQYENLNIDESRRLIRIFNESAAVANMQPLRDSVYYVKRLNWKMGFRFHVITSLSQDPDAQVLRQRNLREIFGDVFDRIHCLDTGADKDKMLDEYRDTGCWWIEDKPENALAGLDRGLKPILMTHDHNQSFDHDHVHRANSWQQIYDIIYESA